MTVHPHVPADDEPNSMIDLVEDCREVSGVLAPYVPHEIRLPDYRGSFPVEIGANVASGFDDWNDYGC